MMFRMVLSFLALSWPMVHASGDSGANRGPDWLSESELKALMLGRTVAGVYPEGTPWRESMHADGRTDYWENGKIIVGRWWFDRDGFLCFRYQPSGGGGCFKYVKLSSNCLEHFARPRARDTDGRDGKSDHDLVDGLQTNGKLWSDERSSTCEAEPTV